MALEHAILVALRERPGSGYELARRFDRSIGFFWTATHQQIYKVLRRMDGLGWVRAEVVAQPDRPDKKVYTPTADGERELARWLTEPSEPQPQRLDLGVKVRAAASGSPADVAAVLTDLRRLRERHAERLDVYLDIEKRDFAAEPVEPAEPAVSAEPAEPAESDERAARPADAVHHLVLRGGVMIEKGWLDWCDEAIRVLEAMA